MNTNSSARIANTLHINTLNTSNLNNNSINTLNSSVKEDTSMKANPVSRFVRRAAASLLALGGLLALTHTAQADVVVDSITTPDKVMGLPAGTTGLQFKVRNTDATNVTGLQITTFMFPVYTDGYAQPSSSVFGLGPHESKTVTVLLPSVDIGGYPMLGQLIRASMDLAGHEYYLDFMDVAPSANVQTSRVTSVGQSNGTDVFTVTFTNNGYATSKAQTATVSTWLYAEGKISTADNQSVNIPALAVGQSYTVRLSTQPTQGYQIYGNVQIGTAAATEFFL